MRFTLFCLSSSAKRNKSLFLTMNTLNTLFLLILCICMGLVKVDENIPDEYLKYTGDAFYRFNRFPDFECAIELFKAIQYCSLSAAVSWKLIPKPKQKMNAKNGCCALWSFQACFLNVIRDQCSPTFIHEYFFYLNHHTNRKKLKSGYCHNHPILAYCGHKKVPNYLKFIATPKKNH